MAKRRINRSALKRLRQAEKRRLRNKAVKTRIKNLIKKFKSSDTEAKKELLKEIYSLLDKAARKGIIHRNKVARQKSKLARLLNQELVA